MNNLPLLVRSGTLKSKAEQTWVVNLPEIQKEAGWAGGWAGGGGDMY